MRREKRLLNKQESSIKKAVLINAIAKYSTVVLQLFFSAILSRILTPKEYGTVAVVSVFIVLFQMLSDFGFGSAVIQKKDLTENEINHIYSITIYLGLVMSLLFSIFSIPISHFYGDSIYLSLGMILSLSLMFNSFNMIPNALILKEKRFYTVAFRMIIVTIIPFVITLVMALKGMGVYALVAQSIISSLLIFLWNRSSVKLRFVIKPSFEPIKKIFSYSFFQFGSQLINYFNRNLDNILIGKLFTSEALGYYNKSYHLMHLPISYLPGVITPALHPILSEHQNDKQYIYEKYTQILKILSLIGCFCSMYFFFLAKEIILLMFGEQWFNAIIPFKLLSLSLWMQLLTNTIGPIYQSLGDTKLMFKSTIITTFLIICSIVTGIFLGSIEKVALLVSIGYIVNFFVTFYIMINKEFQKSFLEFLKCFCQELIIVLFMIFCGLLVAHIDGTLIGTFLIKTLLLVISYIIATVFTKSYKYFTLLIKKK